LVSGTFCFMVSCEEDTSIMQNAPSSSSQNGKEEEQQQEIKSVVSKSIGNSRSGTPTPIPTPTFQISNNSNLDSPSTVVCRSVKIKAM